MAKADGACVRDAFDLVSAHMIKQMETQETVDCWKKLNDGNRMCW